MAVGKVPWLGSLPAFGASNEEYWLGCANALVPSVSVAASIANRAMRMGEEVCDVARAWFFKACSFFRRESSAAVQQSLTVNTTVGFPVAGEGGGDELLRAEEL